jgi:RimJ/RimL family protein N-acetyltransferase
MDEGFATSSVCLTARLRLEPIGPRHVVDLVRLHQDPAVAKWWAGAWTLSEAEKFAESARDGWARHGVHKWIAYRRSDNAMVGRGGLSQMPPEAPTTVQIAALTQRSSWSHSRLELGWNLLSEFHGQGYATEIGRKGLRFARTRLAADSVIAFTERHNTRSRRVAERLGMSYVGEITARGLVEGQIAEAEDAPFALYTSQA